MGRKSKLLEHQWTAIGHRLLAGEAARALGREFKIAESTIRERFSAQHAEIKNVANQMVAADAALRALPISGQISAHNLAEQLRSISGHLAGAARFGAITAHRLSDIANGQVDKISTADPMQTEDILKSIAALTRMANASSEIGLNLLKANKEVNDSADGIETILKRLEAHRD